MHLEQVVEERGPDAELERAERLSVPSVGSLPAGECQGSPQAPLKGAAEARVVVQCRVVVHCGVLAEHPPTTHPPTHTRSPAVSCAGAKAGGGEAVRLLRAEEGAHAAHRALHAFVNCLPCFTSFNALLPAYLSLAIPALRAVCHHTSPSVPGVLIKVVHFHERAMDYANDTQTTCKRKHGTPTIATAARWKGWLRVCH